MTLWEEIMLTGKSLSRSMIVSRWAAGLKSGLLGLLPFILSEKWPDYKGKIWGKIFIHSSIDMMHESEKLFLDNVNNICHYWRGFGSSWTKRGHSNSINQGHWHNRRRCRIHRHW